VPAKNKAQNKISCAIRRALQFRALQLGFVAHITLLVRRPFDGRSTAIPVSKRLFAIVSQRCLCDTGIVCLKESAYRDMLNLQSATDFSVEHYDRVDDKLVETAMDAPNTSVAGGEETFVFAIPEHRIMKIKYKERVVWDRENRIDLVFGSMNGKGETIDLVMKSYAEWQCRRNEEAQLSRISFVK
jgi:uncharacterized protein (UPF0248 family)